MARMLPPYVDRACKSSAEKKLFEFFRRNEFSKDWIILHSLNLSQHTKRLYGEIDFLILIPNAGIFVMEVKGGDVRCRDGEWHFIDRFGNINKNKSPFNQARDAMFSLHSAIEKEFGKGHRFTKLLFGFFCAFPDISFDKHSVEYESWQIFDKNTTEGKVEHFFRDLVQNTIKKHRGQKWFSERWSLPTAEDLNQLCDFLRGDFERIRTIKERLAEFDKEVKRYTEEQFQILDSIQLNNRCLIQGSAGTGKTMIAIESAVRAAAQGQTVFLTCFNRLIGEWMKRQTADWKDRITVSSLHSYLLEVSKGFDHSVSVAEKQDFFSKYLPELLTDIYRKGISEKFDRIIIDEGQDLIREEYLNLFDSMLKNGMSDGNWEIYGDFERQAIYAQMSKQDMFSLLKSVGQCSNFLLRKNCRNTKQIGEETSLICGFEKPPFLLEHLEGIAVEYIFYKDKGHQGELIGKQLKKFADNGLPLNEFMIISSSKFENSCSCAITDFTIREIKYNSDISVSQNFCGFSTIHSYKGMESNYILITDVEDLLTDTAKSLLYIGMSRARYGLTLFISESVREVYRNILRNKLN